MFFNIALLPLKVSCSIVGSWLPMKSVVLLDTATCSSGRDHLLRLLCSKELVYLNPVDFIGDNIVQWLISKSFQITNVVFHPEAKPSHLLVQHFTRYGHIIREVHFYGEDDAAVEKMYIAACFCRSIDVIRCTNVALSSAFHVLLMNNANIKEIWIDDCKCVIDNLMSGVSLHKLCIFSAENGASLSGFPWATTTDGTSLQRFECSFLSNCYADDLAQLTQNCPQLRSFSCKRIGYTDAHYATIFAKPLHLLNLDISGNTAVTDCGLLCIVQNLIQLRTLNVQKCTKLTYLYLMYIAKHCTQIEVLYIDILHGNQVTAQTVHDFSRKCPTVKYLSIISNFVLCTTSCTSSLIQGCPAMHTLVINKSENICTSSRELCKLVRPQLQILTHNKSTEYHVLNMPI